MCLLVVFGFGIYFAFRIPGILKMQPPPNVGQDLFLEWKRLELRSIYVFLAATWGLAALLFIVGLFIGLWFGPADNADERLGIVIGLGIVADLGPLVWAAVLSSRAAKIRKQFQVLAPSYYPRPGQQLLQSPEDSPPPSSEAVEKPPQN